MSMFVTASQGRTVTAYEVNNIISMPYISDEAYITKWLNQNYEKMGFNENYPEYYSRIGLRVRSKSEVIIADTLEEAGIPFLYEKPLDLGLVTVHPDFTLLDISNRKNVYWEHFGMMDESEYRNKAFAKIRRYEEAGLYQWDSVIWTFETGKYPINTRYIRKMIQELKERLGF